MRKNASAPIKKFCANCRKVFWLSYRDGSKSRRAAAKYCSSQCAAAKRVVHPVDRLLTGGLENTETGCLEWTRSLDTKGYGRIGANPFSREILVHRIAWEVAHGPIPDGLHVLHTCDNRKCFETRHLYLGTNDDNVRDRVTRGRGQDLRGEKNGRAKIASVMIPDIRADTRKAADIGAEYGVDASTINRIRSGRAWSHIP